MRNFPKRSDIEFLKGFNITPCDRNIAFEKLADESNVFLDQAFTGINTKAVSHERNSFEKTATTFLSKHWSNLKIAALNINSIEQKFVDILFVLNQQLVDVLVIGESKLNERLDESLFQHPSYETLRRDRVISGGGGVLIFIKKNL